MMVEPKTHAGKCLCGAVGFTFTPAAMHADACHCTMCQRWNGGPGLSIKAMGPPELTGADNVVIYKSSDWGERHFCKTCGSNLFYAAPGFGYFGVSAGALDDLTGFELAMEIFVDHKPDLYTFANATKKLTEAQFLAQFAEPADAPATASAQDGAAANKDEQENG